MIRIAPASILARECAALIASLEGSDRFNGERESYIRAAIRALGELNKGIKVERTFEGWMVPSRERAGLTHYLVRQPDGRYRCDCEAGLAGRACWHKPACAIADRVLPEPAAPTAAQVAAIAPAAPAARPLLSPEQRAARRAEAERGMMEVFGI